MTAKVLKVKVDLKLREILLCHREGRKQAVPEVAETAAEHCSLERSPARSAGVVLGPIRRRRDEEVKTPGV